MIETIVNQAGTKSLARTLAALAKPRDVILLYGDLGMGKTVFSRAFVQSLTSPDEDVPSPTFTLVQLYDTDKGTIWHFDLYRLKQPDEVYELGFEEALSDGISLIEWPERAERLYPRNRLEIRITAGDAPDTRRVALIPHGDGWNKRLENLQWRTD